MLICILCMNTKPKCGVCHKGVDDINIKNRYGINIINDDCLMCTTQAVMMMTLNMNIKPICGVCQKGWMI